MRTTALLLLWVLIATMAAQVDGWWLCGCRRRQSRRKRERTCKSLCASRIGKRSVEELMIPGQTNDFSKQWQNLVSSVSKSRPKRALKRLKFPADCNSSKLQNFARKCNLCVAAGGSHIKVCSGSRQVTTIPHHVKSNGTCRSIINVLNNLCL